MDFTIKYRDGDGAVKTDVLNAARKRLGPDVERSGSAVLSNMGDMTLFSHNGIRLRFLAPKCLVKYTAVKKWHDGYLEVMADYGDGEVEEYIDLRPILRNLFIDQREFLDPIKNVEIVYA